MYIYISVRVIARVTLMGRGCRARIRAKGEDEVSVRVQSGRCMHGGGCTRRSGVLAAV